MNGRVGFAALVFVGLCSVAARGDRFMLTDRFGGRWGDTEKTGDPAPQGGDTNLCWAATAANMLWWAGWNGQSASADAILDHFQAHWTNESGSPMEAMQWWFTGQPTAMGTTTHVYQTGGGGFYTRGGRWGALFGEALFAAVTQIDFDRRGLIHDMWHWMHAGNAIGLCVALDEAADAAHIITVWGIEYDEYNWFGSFTRIYKGLWITDSEDNVGPAPQLDSLRYYPLSYDSTHQWWELAGMGDHIDIMYGLARTLEPVPEPWSGAAWLAIGATAVVAVSRSARRKTGAGHRSVCCG